MFPMDAALKYFDHSDMIDVDGWTEQRPMLMRYCDQLQISRPHSDPNATFPLTETTPGISGKIANTFTTANNAMREAQFLSLVEFEG